MDNWSEDDIQPQLENFLRNPGLNILPNNNNKNVSDVVKLFIGDDLFELMATETSRYRSQIIHKQCTRNECTCVTWKDVTTGEMKKFLALIILMGQVRKDNLYDYWSTSSLIETPFFSKTMSRTRFLEIWKMWHFCNNNLISNDSDRLIKIKPVLSYLQERFSSIYTPNQQLSIHETIVPWLGRWSYRTNNPENDIKYGVLVRMVCDATNGYICNLQLYSSKEKLKDSILSLISPFIGYHHHLYMNNYENTPNTAEVLLTKNIRICAPVNANELPESLQTKLEEGEIKFLRKGQVLVQVWQAKKTKTIRIISTIHSAKVSKKNIKPGKTVSEPECVVQSNKYMKGVERADQYISYYNIVCKKTKWTKKVALYLLNCAFFNAYVMYKNLNNSKMSYRKFLLAIVAEYAKNPDFELKEPSTSSEITKPAPKYDPPERLSMDFEKHKLVRIFTGGRKKYPHRKCRVCTVNNKNGYTRYICDFCGVPLHKLVCFEKYHTLQQY